MTSPRNVFSATQTPDEGGSGVGAPLLDSAAVCALLGVQRDALARYRAAGLPFVILAPGVYRYRRADLDAWTGHNMTAPTYWHGGPRIHGDRVLSPEVTGRTRSGDYGVHVTTERTLAEAYASTIKGTPWVYEVIPEGVLEPVTSFVGGPTISYRCASARIVRRFSVPRETRAAYRDLIMPMLGTVR